MDFREVSRSDIVDSWPPPRQVGDTVFQIITRHSGSLSILSFQLSSAGLVRVSIREAFSAPRRCFTRIYASGDSFAYSVYNVIPPADPRFILCRNHSFDQRLSFEPISFSIVPFMPFCTLFDAFSSRVVLYDYSGSRIHIGSFVVEQS